MRGQHVVARDVLDVEKLILGGDLADRDHLDAVFLAARRIEKQVAKITQPLALLQRLFQILDLRLVGQHIGQVQDVAGVRTVNR